MPKKKKTNAASLKKGDRVAVLGRGIAVVEKIDHNQVHVLLRNTYALRVPRNHVVWDQQNRRWGMRSSTLGGISMRVALYARVSTCNGQSPEMQLAELREYASRREWEVFNEYVDQGISGSKESRPELESTDVGCAPAQDRCSACLEDRSDSAGA